MLSVSRKVWTATSTHHTASLLRSASLSKHPNSAANVCVVGTSGVHGDWFLLIFLGDDTTARRRPRG
jgi:hypothetical protein